MPRALPGSLGSADPFLSGDDRVSLARRYRAKAAPGAPMTQFDDFLGYFDKQAEDAAAAGLDTRVDLRGIMSPPSRRSVPGSLGGDPFDVGEGIAYNDWLANAPSAGTRDQIAKDFVQAHQQAAIEDLKRSHAQQAASGLAAPPVEPTMLQTNEDATDFTMRPAADQPTTPEELLRRLSPLDRQQAYAEMVKAQTTDQLRHSPQYLEYRDAVAGGYRGTFDQYQTDDANRKRKTDDADEAMIEAAATNILANPRDLTSIKTITSLRGDQRLKLFNRIKEKNPDFNIGNVDRQIKFLDSYEDPKGRAAINRGAMNNILQHAADLSTINQEYGRTNLRIVNTPIGVLSRQGGTEWNRFATPLSVLKDELSLYFAGGYAPTVDQQKTWDKIANDTATPAQIEQFAKDIIHVGLRRADTHNEQFKTMMGYDDPNLLTPEAVQAGQQLGLGAEMKKYGSGGTIGRPASNKKQIRYDQFGNPIEK